MDYQNCTVDDLVQHIQRSTRQAIAQQISYYEKKGRLDIANKIRQARATAKYKRETEGLTSGSQQ